MEERQIFFADYPEGDYAAINATDKWAEFEVFDTIDRKTGRACFTRDESIAAAKAILKHFNEDWNAYEENISERYRAPTAEEM